MMASFEDQLMGGIPLHEAADFFTSMKQPTAAAMQEKVAGAASDLMDSLANGGPMPAGKAGRFKPVDEIKESEKTAATLREVEGKTTSKMEGLYRDAGAIRGGAKGGATGGAAGTIVGAGIGALKGGKGGALRGAARGAIKGLGIGGGGGAIVGGAVGAKKGKEKGQHVGQHINTMRRGSIAKSMAMSSVQKKLLEQAQKDPEFRRGLIEASGRGRMNKAAEAEARFLKLAFGEEGGGMAGGGPNMEGGQPAPAAQQSAPGMTPPEAGTAPAQDPQAAMPTTAPTVPVNYMTSELMARAAQEANEVGFLRERLNAATEQNQAAQQQMQQAQAQLEQMQQETAASGEQIMAATNEAVAASDRALQQSLQAANMRMGIQKMRESMLQLASQDPESMGTMAQAEQQQAVAAEQQAVDAQAGTPGQTGSPATGTGSPAAGAGGPGGPGPEGGGDGSSASPSGSNAKPQISIKTGSPMAMALPGAVAGAGLAALQGYRQSTQGVEDAQAEVSQLEQEQQSGSFGKALDLAKAKKRLADNELAQAHPVKSNIKEIVGGALGGAAVGAAGKQLWDTARHVL